jgi:signal transduction histidine kinase
VLGTDVTELHLSYERIRNLAQRVETSREQERRSIARMLHEGIAQELAAVRLHLEALRSQTHDERDVARLCDNLNHALQNCMEELRQGADELRPAMLGHLRLADALRAHARGFAALSRLRVEVAEVPTFPSVDESTRVLFFRAAEEALTNVASYAAAKRVDIMLHADADRLFMDVRDDGIGIPEGAMDRPGSFGLLGIRERFAARGGTMSICSTAPTGTRLSVSLPLNAAQ